MFILSSDGILINIEEVKYIKHKRFFAEEEGEWKFALVMTLYDESNGDEMFYEWSGLEGHIISVDSDREITKRKYRKLIDRINEGYDVIEITDSDGDLLQEYEVAD